MEAFYFEEKYDIFLSNYLVIEKEVLINTIDRYFLGSKPYKFFHESRLILNRLFINFLSGVRMYQDQVPSHVENCLDNDRHVIKNLKNLFSKEFDLSIEYQSMEFLRNHTQHGGQAVHSITFQNKNVGNGDSAKNQFSISIWALKSVLMENPKFPKNRLSSVDEKVD
ncbi:hypothetical protein G9Q97_22825 [Cyclobacterium sp. GBPx2]|uniref:Cthe-2314-like HEPN domain-containing protein n=1 Tax=Cyclobacterium plantarum TaxID=2716263 RepID=A0ABX0HD00_9BACT|nr:hypothetical protein [Cyclobacterium plantarum]